MSRQSNLHIECNFSKSSFLHLSPQLDALSTQKNEKTEEVMVTCYIDKANLLKSFEWPPLGYCFLLNIWFGFIQSLRGCINSNYEYIYT